MVITIIFFILLIGVLVIVHEFGHFFAAKKLKVRVDEFAFGFPPRLWSVMRGGTRYAVNLLPFGGYVKIFGESGEGEGLPESFISRSIAQRFLIIAAGVVMNFGLAWFLFSLGAGIGVPTVETPENASRIRDAKVGIVSLVKNSPAESADVRFGDLVIRVESEEESVAIVEIGDLQSFVSRHLGEEMTLQIQRGSTVHVKKVVPRQVSPEGQGPLGVTLSKIGIMRSPWHLAGFEGARVLFVSTAALIEGFIGIFRDLFVSGKVSADLSGPVGIFFFARQFGELGFVYLLQLAAILSVNLAILNILPFPALDGGRILFLGIEKIKGSKVDQKWERMIHAAGFVILMLLMLAVTYRDIARIF